MFESIDHMPGTNNLRVVGREKHLDVRLQAGCEIGRLLTLSCAYRIAVPTASERLENSLARNE